MKKTMFKSTVITFLAVLSGCASQQIANTKHMDDVALQKAKVSTQTPQEVCEAASIAISKANKEKLHFYAPLHLERAAETLLDGQKEIKSAETQMDGVKKCYKVNSLIEEGIKTKAKVMDALSDVLVELNRLNKVDSRKKFTNDIQDFKDEIIDLIKDIESGKMNAAMQGQAALNKEMLELEIDIVIDKNLTPVSAMLEKAEDADADDLAEKTFEKAEKELESAKKFVRANFRNDEQVMESSALAMRSAKHAYYVALEVEKLMGLKEEAAEERILYFESLIERINKKFDNEVVIGNSLYEQASIVSERVETLQDDYKKKSQLALSAQLLSTELKEAQPPAVEKTDSKVVEANDEGQPKLQVETAAATATASRDMSVQTDPEPDTNLQKKDEIEVHETPSEARPETQIQAQDQAEPVAGTIPTEAQAALVKPDNIESTVGEVVIDEASVDEDVDAQQASAPVDSVVEEPTAVVQSGEVPDVVEVEVEVEADAVIEVDSIKIEVPTEPVEVQKTQE